jgi:hypothetical protein
MSLTDLKSKAKKLIQQAYALPLLPSVSKIKKMFFELDLRTSDAWYEIIDLMIERLQMLEDFHTSSEKAFRMAISEQIYAEARKFGCYCSEPFGSITSISSTLFFNRMKVGLVSFDLDSRRWTYLPTNFLNLKASSLEDAIVLMLQRRGISLAQALGIC